MEHRTDGIHVICLVRPGKLHLWVPCAKDTCNIPLIFSHHSLGHDEQRRTILRNKFLHRQIFNFRFRLTDGRISELVHKSGILFVDDRPFVLFFTHGSVLRVR